MNKILVSACLLGNPVRYDGQSKALNHSLLNQLVAEGRVISFCPEVAGGLSVPRAAAEIQAGDGDAVINGLAQVKTQAGIDVTGAFVYGAQQALALCRQHDIAIAVLTEISPSCGSKQIYDGSFNRNKISGSGVTTSLLQKHGIEVYNQHQLAQVLSQLDSA